ncbi:hypothetical protein [Thalassoglobus polymorphus]|uniref:Uncharacterized protein n=1 Tax=Thalassoglobus polymorphus TaxID=2527994 RepID=A0A517QH29_9PLAN|nr:hypothetical protein [Thalassoglobus polymorphus]QDT30938.1 hypothetical protein Mal48_01670 [Thalassoglobus polymorphus]
MRPKVLSFDPATGQTGSFSTQQERTRLYEAHVSDLDGAEDALYEYESLCNTAKHIRRMQR